MTTTVKVLTDAQASRREFAQRMNRVLDHIDAHLDDSLPLAELAVIAHFSAFHFHRVFVAWMGETLGDYVRRRRVELGAWLLMRRADMPVLEVALTVGFGSGEAFSRAFRDRFEMSPSQWRATRGVGDEDSNIDQAQRKFDQTFIRCRLDHEGSEKLLKEPTIMEVKLLQLPPRRIAYLRHIGPYGPTLGLFWQTFHKTCAAHGLAGEMFGIGLDDPHITAPEKCRYDAAVTIGDDVQVSAPFSVGKLPGGRYAVAEYDGDSGQVSAAWNTFLSEWLPQSGMQFDARPAFEWYRTDDIADAVTGRFSCGLCIPVAAL